MFFTAYTFEGQVHVFAGRVKILSHLSCRTSATLKCFCPLIWDIFHVLVVVCLLFSKLTYSKNAFRNTIRVTHSLDPDQDRCFVSPDLGPKCLRRLPADNKSRGLQTKSYGIVYLKTLVLLNPDYPALKTQYIQIIWLLTKPSD